MNKMLLNKLRATLALFYYNRVMLLKELRLSKKITQVDAAKIADIPLRTYKRLESDPKYVGSIKYENCMNLLGKNNKHRNKLLEKYEIAIVGAGYVGYTLGLVLSKHNNVVLIDINEEKVNQINKENILKASLPNSNLYKNKNYIFICVPTNYDVHTGLLDTEIVKKVVEDIRKVNTKVTVVIKSTCNIGFTESLNDKNIIYCPEFLREKSALEDMRRPSRIIIGCDNENKNAIKLGKLLQNSAFNRPQVLYMSTKEAESVKLFSNAYLAMRVSYFNELDSFAKDNNLDTNQIISGVSLDPRIGDYYNNPSAGYSGKCLPKDTLALSHLTKSELISSIDRSNEKRKERFM